ncbi:MAG: hypothetical protein A2Y97_09220 [Nitrospirae bacterium RBG_13_39_12]|nr:MAG: hypothetical protein A2Y97_09220 [Nitrospirae bacterium RBG_13_39_12]
MAKLKKGQKMVCVPCAREVVISSAGVSRTTLWCCGRPMTQKSKAAPKKKIDKKPAKKSAK